MSKRPLPNLEDVARAAGVSTATVSRTINTPDKVSPQTRERVDAAVKALHYAPNFGARAIASNRTGTFGAIIPTMENAIFARGIEAFQNHLIEHNATMLLASSGYDQAREEALIRTMVARGADGILLIGEARDPAIYAFLEAQNIPVVLSWTKAEPLNRSFVGFDNFQAMEMMATKALSLGHKHIAYISAPFAGNDRATARLKGVKQAMQNAALDEATLLTREVPYAVHHAALATQEIIHHHPETTLIICGNDVLAVGALKAVKQLGLAVPQHISITGFDDILVAEIIDPPLTTVHVPHREMGRQAAAALLSMVDGPSMVIRTQLPTYIVERGSLAGPR